LEGLDNRLGSAVNDSKDVLKPFGAAVVGVGDLLMLITLGIELPEHSNFIPLFVVPGHGSKTAKMAVVHSKKNIELLEILGSNCPGRVGERIPVFDSGRLHARVYLLAHMVRIGPRRIHQEL